MDEKELEGLSKIDLLSKTLKILIYILVLVIIIVISTNLSIKLDVKDYDMVYGEKINNKYYYFKNNKEQVEIKKFKDFYNKKVNKIDDKYVPLLYCSKKECLYIDLGNRMQRNNLYPKFMILILVLIIAILELILYIRKEKPNKTKYKILYIFLILITLIGLIRDGKDVGNYYLTVNKNKNLEKGIVLGQRADNRYVIKYEVDNKLYYLDSNTDNNNIYYNKKDNKVAYNKMNPFNIKLLLIYLLNIIFIIIAQIMGKKKGIVTENNMNDNS